MGVNIPPSIIMVSGRRHERLGGRASSRGILPGVLIGVLQMVVVYIYAKKRHYPARPVFSP
jgi:TRAP-type C4-dicarboxylate transport system permease large subunit